MVRRHIVSGGRRRVRHGLHGAAVAALLVGVAGFTPAARAAGSASVSISPTTATTPSGAAVTYTLTVSCSVTGGCQDTTVAIPATAITGNGPRNDFSAWIGPSSCSTVMRTASAGQVNFSYGSVPTGTMQCTFTVAPPNWTTLNEARLTITPSLSGSNFDPSTASSAELTVTAGHNNRMTKTAPPNATSGLEFTYSLSYFCGGPSYTGDLGLSALTITDSLPANFTFTRYETPKSLPGTFTYDAGTRTLTYSDPTGETCGNPSHYTAVGNVGNQVVINVSGRAARDGVGVPAGEKICNRATATFTYVDGTTGTATPPEACSTAAGRVPANFLSKVPFAGTMANAGQYVFPPNGAAYPYTFPGDWDGSGRSVLYEIRLATTVAKAGAMFAVQDPLPCLSNFSGQEYSSNPPGSYCQAPAFIPTVITPHNFTPSASDAVTLVHPDGSTSTVNYVAGTGFPVPTSPPVAQIDFPPFPEEGENTNTVTFQVHGHAAPEALPADAPADARVLLTNSVSAQAYAVDAPGTQITPEQTKSGSLLVASPTEPSGVILRPVLRSSYAGNCRATVGFTQVGAPFYNSIEIARAPSEAIYLDYLAPAGATGITPQDVAFTLEQVHSRGTWYQTTTLAGGQRVTTAAIAPTVTPDHNGTGRTLYQWVIPAGTVTRPGYYVIRQSDLTVTLGPGCAGVYQNDLTVGYGAPVTSCYYGFYYFNSTSPAPTDPAANDDLQSNAVAPPGSYCGTSAPLTVTAVNPGFRVDKTVQGNLDGQPASAGGIGNVSPSGGTATYNVTFTNTGGSNLADPVLYDILPTVGDTGASTLSGRNSQFPVTLTGVGPLPDGVSATYSTSTKPCRPEVLPANPGCVNDWSPTPPEPLSAVTALRFTYAGTVVVDGAPGTNSFSIPFTVSTPPGDPGRVAWNSVGATAYAGQGGSLIAPAESSVTGLQTRVGPTIAKASTTPSYSTAGDSLSYTFTVTNDTSVPLTEVRVVDELIDAPAGSVAPATTCESLANPAGTCSGPVTTLQPNQSATFVATYATSQADVDAGSISDAATVTASPPTGGALTNRSAIVAIPAVQTTGITLAKTATPSTVTGAGQTVTYSYLVTNRGNVTLGSVNVAESAFTGTGAAPGPACPQTTLAPDAAMTCTATYTVTQADVDAGSIDNTAKATGTPPAGDPLSSLPASARVTAPADGAIGIVKSASPSDPTAFTAGQPITYSYVVTNTGNVTLTGVTVQETTFTGNGPVPVPACPESKLAPGAQMTCSAPYTLTQDDIDGGSITNVANATGETPEGSEVLATASSLTIPHTQDPALALVKHVTPAKVTAAGQPVTYTFVVTNTGNVTLRNVGVEEGAFSGSGAAPAPSCPEGVATMLPGMEVTCTATYTVTQADIDAGHVANTATAGGDPPAGPPVASPPSSATVITPAGGLITLVKSANPSGVTAYTAGQVITYSYVVTNRGNVTLRDVKVQETTFTGSGAAPVPGCPSRTLAPGAQTTCAATYTLTQADIDRGSVTNVANATGRPPTGPRAISEASSVTIPHAPSPALSVVKTADPTRISQAGENVTYTFRVTNTGNVTASDVKVNEVAFSGTGPTPVAACPAEMGSMLPGIELACQATYTATAVDAAAGLVTNTAVAAGTAPRSAAALVAPPSSAEVTVSGADVGDPGPQGTTTLPRTGAGQLDRLVTTGIISTVVGAAAWLGRPRRRRRQSA